MRVILQVCNTNYHFYAIHEETVVHVKKTITDWTSYENELVGSWSYPNPFLHTDNANYS